MKTYKDQAMKEGQINLVEEEEEPEKKYKKPNELKVEKIIEKSRNLKARLN